jgi:hypothetical protein
MSPSRPSCDGDRVRRAVAVRQPAQGAHRERPSPSAAHFAPIPLLAARAQAAGSDMREELRGRRGGRRLGPRAPDVDARMVVGAADAVPPCVSM